MAQKLGPTNAYAYVAGGHGTFTLEGNKSRFTYKLSQAEDKGPIFVRTLTGSNNESDYTYIGYIPKSGASTNIAPLHLKAGKKGRPDASSFKALTWWLNAYAKDSEIAAKASFYHEGTCGRCGRKLTTPESITNGIGPVCLAKV